MLDLILLSLLVDFCLLLSIYMIFSLFPTGWSLYIVWIKSEELRAEKWFPPPPSLLNYFLSVMLSEWYLCFFSSWLWIISKFIGCEEKPSPSYSDKSLQLKKNNLLLRFCCFLFQDELDVHLTLSLPHYCC